jgi:hypothetical protein
MSETSVAAWKWGRPAELPAGRGAAGPPMCVAGDAKKEVALGWGVVAATDGL